jgi:hypothetical protein
MDRYQPAWFAADRGHERLRARLGEELAALQVGEKSIERGRISGRHCLTGMDTRRDAG